MQLNSGGSSDITILQSDDVAFRGVDKTFNDGRAFVVGSSRGATVSQYGFLQILNPAGSGVIGIVDRLKGGLTINSTLYLKRYDTALSSLSTIPTNMKADGAANNLQWRSEANASWHGTTIAHPLVEAYEMYDVLEGGELVLDEGDGFILATASHNISLYGTCRFREYVK